MQDSMMEQMRSTSHLSGSNAAYIEELYETFLEDPNSLSEQWRNYFEKLVTSQRKSGGNGSSGPVILQDIPHSPVRNHFLLLGKNRNRVQPLAAGTVSSEHEKKQIRVLQLINAYRFRGHQRAQLDPLGLMVREKILDLDLGFHGLSDADLNTVFQTGSFFIGTEESTLGDIEAALQQTYCSTVGAEYMHIVDTSEKRWLQQRFESVRSHPSLSSEGKLHLLDRLIAAEGLEKYLATKYPGTKRFGLEGGESLIPSLDVIIQRAGSYGVQEIVIAMAHRGRLNVLVNILGKNPAELFEEFEGKSNQVSGSGDVKYHQGFSSNVMTPGGEMHLALAFNPSHLEIVSPVVEGSVRARQDRRDDFEGDKVIPIVVHGDAAFAGQGVVMETFQMSQTRAYRTGGTLHIIINNQLGFTTSRRDDTRSTEYCTDVAKMVQAPIFHVNADDPEAVLFVTKVALDYRMQFKKDVVIDLVCYRRHGHNEADEPSGTQPIMYQQIKQHSTTQEIYANKLIEGGVLDEKRTKRLVHDYRDFLDAGIHVVKSLVKEPNKSLFVDWEPYLGHKWTAHADTRFDIKLLQELTNHIQELPEGFVLQNQVAKIFDDRRKMAAGALPINWGFAEIMAYATLLSEGHSIRLIGQDSGRGTFSHRHGAVHNQKDGSTYVPLQALASDEIQFNLHDSLLSEEAALAFEYGYSTTAPNVLVIWEAQFGDFANGAQVVIDQFISSGQHKWGRLCGLTLFLPHGYEGQGPEHSSARLERFLQLCAEHNIQVCVPTTPAQIFHMLRRQIIRPLRKPLIVMTPKSLLRHKMAISSLDDLAEGQFQTVIPEVDSIDPLEVKRVIMCSGKVYYDLLEKRRADNRKDIVIIRIEQLYPFPEKDLSQILSLYVSIEKVIWCQEEPLNQGVWYSSQHHMRRVIAKQSLAIELQCVARPASAAPAAGNMSLHVRQQQDLIATAMGE